MCTSTLRENVLVQLGNYDTTEGVRYSAGDSIKQLMSTPYHRLLVPEGNSF